MSATAFDDRPSTYKLAVAKLSFTILTVIMPWCARNIDYNCCSRETTYLFIFL